MKQSGYWACWDQESGQLPLLFVRLTLTLQMRFQPTDTDRRSPAPRPLPRPAGPLRHAHEGEAAGAAEHGPGAVI